MDINVNGNKISGAGLHKFFDKDGNFTLIVDSDGAKNAQGELIVRAQHVQTRGQGIPIEITKTPEVGITSEMFDPSDGNSNC